MQRIGVRHHHRDQRVAGFVIRRVLLLLVGDDERLALHAHDDLVFREFEIDLRDDFAILTSRHQRGFVHQVRQIGAGKTGRSASDHAEFDIVRQRSLLGVDPENHLAALYVGTADHYAAVETAGAQQARDRARQDGSSPRPGSRLRSIRSRPSRPATG